MTDRGRVFEAGVFQAARGRRARRRTPETRAPDLGALPQWRLDDLYEGMDSPRFAADLERAAAERKASPTTYQGKLAGLAKAADAGERLSEAVAPTRRCRT